MLKERLILRPPDSDIPRQFLKDSLMNLCVGIVEMVLSQFWTLTVCRAMSITSPSALAWGIDTQSPIRIMSLDMICTLATNDRIVSLKTSISTAAKAPSPERKTRGERFRSTAAATIPAAMYASRLSTCR